MKDLFEFLGIIIAAVLIVAIIMLPTIFICEKTACDNYQEITNRNTKYKLFGGCFVESSSGWVTKDEYGQIIIAKEGLLNK